jgi:hypothetical protein
VRPELRRKAMAKIEAAFLQGVAFLSVGETYFSEKRKTIIQKGFWRNSPQRKQYESALRRVPDKEFEGIMTKLDSMPNDLHKAIKDSLRYMPKNRGGRPPAFSLEIRKRAIQDVGHEYPRCDSFAEAVDVVAARYGMTAEYLRKVWKNRKRLRQREV